MRWNLGSVRVALRATAVLLVGAAITFADDWPQWRGPQRDGVWRETGVLKKFDSGRVKILWRAPISSGYSGPTVADGRVYVSDRVVQPEQIERVHCFDAASGKRLWTHSYACAYRGVDYDAGPRASITVDDGRAYALGAMGHLHCLDAKTGAVVWHLDLNVEYKIRMPVWGIAAAPLVEDDLVIVQIGGEGEACLAAFDKKNGKAKWQALKDDASYVAPMVIDQAGKRVLVGYTGQNVVGLDPQTGKVYWEYSFPPRRMVIGIASPVVHDDLLFITNFFDGSLLLRLGQDAATIEKVWQRAGKSEKETDALHSTIATPVINAGHIYGVDSYGELRCLDLEKGDRIWESLAAGPKARWATIHFTPNGDRTWLFNEKGELIIADLTPAGYKEIGRAKLIQPTRDQLPSRRGGVTWSHPAFAYKHVFARNDKEIVCGDLSAK